MGGGQPVEQVGDRPLAEDDAEALLDHPVKVDPAPAHSVRRRIGASLDDLGQFRHPSHAQAASTAQKQAIAGPLGSFRHEA